MARDFTADNSSHEIVPDSPAGTAPFHNSHSEITVGMWIAIGSSNNGAQCFWEIGGSTNGLQMKYQIVPDTIKFTTAIGGTAVAITSSSTYPNNEGVWRPTVCRYDGGSMELFINGASEATGSNGSSIGASTDDPSLGNVQGGDADTGATVNYEGYMAEFAVWETALTDAEIVAWSNGVPANAIRPQDLGCYLPMKDWTSNLSTEPDWSGNKRNGAVTGTSVTTDHPPVFTWPPPVTPVYLTGAGGGGGGPTFIPKTWIIN